LDYAGTGTLGMQTQIPMDWARSISKAREFSQPGKIAFLRVISSFNYSEAQQAASALGRRSRRHWFRSIPLRPGSR